MNKITVVQKFGGASLATLNGIKNVAKIILYAKRQKEQRLCIVVSAMGKMTDFMIELANALSISPDKRELDALLSCGEKISASLLAIHLTALGEFAVSFNALQAGIKASSDYGEARLFDINTSQLLDVLSNGGIPVITGFQGINDRCEFVTLGRGGSDLTAVALGSVLQADRIEFYKNVNGVYDQDPLLHSNAIFYPDLDYKQAKEIILHNGHHIISKNALDYAEEKKMKLRVLSFDQYMDETSGTLIHTTP